MTTPIGERELHAYADGQLDPAQRAQIDAYLASQPDAQDQVRDWRKQNQALHRLYDGVLNEAVPARLTTALQPQPMLRALAAGIACLACGLLAGWFAHAAITPRNTMSTAFAHHALAAHVLYAVEQRHPVEVPAAQEAHLVAWLSKRLAAPIRAPDLQGQGFSLLGGRLLPGEDTPLAQIMYESAGGERLSLTVRHAAVPQPASGFQLLEKNGTSVFYWIDRQYGYALSGSMSRARMLEVAQAIHTQRLP